MTPEQEYRFWAKVEKTDGCWIWKGARRAQGYGMFGVGHHKHKRAHRLVYELFYGPIPPGLLVCHRCDNPSCVRPDHLFLGTSKDNVRDAISKGRMVSNTQKRFKPSRLTEYLVREIRRLHKDNYSIDNLAEMFGVSRATIWEVVNRITWKQVI